MENTDIRWEQRFENFGRALAQLGKFIDKKTLSELEDQGLIKSFEYTYELCWLTLKDYLLYQGKSNIVGARDAFRQGFQDGVIEDGEVWMGMIANRNLTAHTYNQRYVKEIKEAVFKSYYPLFCQFERKMQTLRVKNP